MCQVEHGAVIMSARGRAWFDGHECRVRDDEDYLLEVKHGIYVVFVGEEDGEIISVSPDKNRDYWGCVFYLVKYSIGH